MSSSFATGLAEVCRFVSALSWDAIPAPVRQRAVEVVCDDLAAMAAGSREPELRRYASLLLALGNAADAALISPALPRVGRLEAASWNALAGNWCELDEGFRLAICHAGIYTLPALLAEACATRASLRQVLTALTGAYELVTRCAMSFHVMPPPVHGHALWSAVGAAAAVSLLRVHDAATLQSAVSGAITTASMGPRSHLMSGILIRNGWAAAGSVNGMQCADWAECGFGGGTESMEAVCVEILGAELREGEITRDLGSRWSLTHGYQKLYSCCQHGHSAVQACIALRETHGLDPQRIRSIHLATHPLALTLDSVHPQTTLGARFSMPHMVAASLALGNASAQAFSLSTLDDPLISRLREKVQMRLADHPMKPPHDRPAWVDVEMDDGQRYSADCQSAIGSPDNPVSKEQFQAKLADLAAGILPGLPQAVQPDVWQMALDMETSAWLSSMAA
ncbi:MmgE/PrpD family protein [Bordetella holmesii]|uniref:MmgE/PrpD family protein n=1 Tax=Bordetella holmesii TaxID=35814 RepID=UPI0004475DD7|nr:MmgE/PrpD family protein [Bordetella holmesii]EWM45601.1 mmgE/PrpD family protein [Bordetella holmesii 70147]QGD45634.1 MmgE/PrpD family protein [Bordetella holmesii]